MKKSLSLILPFMGQQQVSFFDPQAAYSLVKSNQGVIVDVREADEIRSGMIDQAAWFPLSKIQGGGDWREDFAKLTEGKRVFLYCQVGKRSEKVKNILRSYGIRAENIGGLNTISNQLPVTAGGERVNVK